MELRLDGKVALVTGGSRGIGKEIAKYFSEAGARVMISSRKPEGCEAAAEELGNGVTWRAGNSGNLEDAESIIDATLEEHGGLDILVNNAATNPYAGPLIDIDVPRWDKIMSVNVTAPLMWTQLCWNKRWKDGADDQGASVINLASVGAFATNRDISAYGISKSTLIRVTEQLSVEMAPKVRVNAIAPGLIKTDFAKFLWEDGRGDKVAQAYPLKRLGEVTDIAEAAMYLAAAATWMTGEVITLDGGGRRSFPMLA